MRKPSFQSNGTNRKRAAKANRFCHCGEFAACLYIFIHAAGDSRGIVLSRVPVSSVPYSRFPLPALPQTARSPRCGIHAASTLSYGFGGGIRG